MAQASAEVDGGDTTRSRPTSDPQLSYAKTPPTPAPASFAQPQHWLDEDDDNHYGDDEQEYDPDDTECDYYERECSATPTPPPVQQQQQQQQHYPSHQTPPLPPPPQLQQQQQQQQWQSQPQQAQSSSGPSSFVAHVHFHSRVRITSGLRHSRGGGGTHALDDSSDSDSPSSSISAPLRFRSRDTMPRAPLTERVSRLATQALQRRRAIADTRVSSAVSRLLARDCEYAPLIGAGVPVTYGAARYGISVSNRRANGVREQAHDEDDSAFGEWPWRALNRHWWKWQIESTLCCCCSDGSDPGE